MAWAESTPSPLATNNLLDELFAGAIADANTREQQISLKSIETLALEQGHHIDAAGRLAPASHIHVIAEIKRASPSKGRMAQIADPAKLAKTYADAGASAISVLTESRQFLGSPEDLLSVRLAVELPLLRKDFIANEYQVFEARAWGANIVLLIAAWLEPSRLKSLKHLIEELGMTAFVEAHDEREVDVAVESGARLIGINARDLATFQTDRNLYAALAERIPTGITKVAESAVRNLEDVKQYRAAGADAVLVGEALVTGDPNSLIRSFVGC